MNQRVQYMGREKSETGMNKILVIIAGCWMKHEIQALETTINIDKPN